MQNLMFQDPDKSLQSMCNNKILPLQWKESSQNIKRRGQKETTFSTL